MKRARAVHDHINYYLQRVRMEIRQARSAAKREVSMAHFNLADAYLERIHQFFQEVASGGAEEK
jgi:hypothetical protein